MHDKKSVKRIKKNVKEERTFQLVPQILEGTGETHFSVPFSFPENHNISGSQSIRGDSDKHNSNSQNFCITHKRMQPMSPANSSKAVLKIPVNHSLTTHT